MPIELAAARDGPLAADVERRERVDLPGVRDPGDHAVLLLDGWIRRGRLHASPLERLARVRVELGEDRRGLDRLRRKRQRRARTHGPGRRPYRSTVLRDERARHAVEGTRAVDIVLDDLDAGDLSCLDGRVHLVDRRLFEAEWSHVVIHPFTLSM